MVGLPMSIDQPYNVYRAADLGMGVAVDMSDAGRLAGGLRQAVARVLGDAGFRKSAQKLSNIMHARRRKPAEVAAGDITARRHDGEGFGSTLTQNPQT